LSDSDRKDLPREWPDVDRRGEMDRRGVEREAAGHRTRRSGHDRRDESAWESVPLELTLAKDDEVASEQTLVDAAKDARTRAHARYSGFKVGAALETTDGQIVAGCNIENATYGLTLCAERVALVKALSDGHSIFTRIAVVADTEDPTPPCGPCRQLLWEYCGDIDVILANLERTTATLRLSALLPMPFDNRLLE
jgi:cytidine deaminase